jgi:hypothetical protein
MCQFLNLTKFFDLETVDPSKIPNVGVFNKSTIMTGLKMAINYHESANSKALHPCPIVKGEFKQYNVSSSLKLDFEKILPSGDYRYEHLYWNDDDDLIFKHTVYERFKTQEDSFF